MYEPLSQLHLQVAPSSWLVGRLHVEVTSVAADLAAPSRDSDWITSYPEATP